MTTVLVWLVAVPMIGALLGALVPARAAKGWALVVSLLTLALGMMFRSGNFLNAFAISFIPALIAITLIVAGQRVGGSLPLQYPKAENPIQLGLMLCWAGNAANAVLATVLWWRLQRQ